MLRITYLLVIDGQPAGRFTWTSRDDEKQHIRRVKEERPDAKVERHHRQVTRPRDPDDVYTPSYMRANPRGYPTAELLPAPGPINEWVCFQARRNYQPAPPPPPAQSYEDFTNAALGSSWENVRASGEQLRSRYETFNDDMMQSEWGEPGLISYNRPTPPARTLPNWEELATMPQDQFRAMSDEFHRRVNETRAVRPGGQERWNRFYAEATNTYADWLTRMEDERAVQANRLPNYRDGVRMLDLFTSTLRNTVLSPPSPPPNPRIEPDGYYMPQLPRAVTWDERVTWGRGILEALVTECQNDMDRIRNGEDE